ncbi:CBS domain-containing protein [Streptomyces sp. NPDC004610]|uniref:CBS domain-containing protein n=1 Tax=unclassified Streptomyces TaxID=2593676 RepID=UPI0033B4D3D5
MYGTYGISWTVRDVMTRSVVAVGPDAGFKEIVRLLHGHGVGALPVVAGNGRVVGVVSEADLLPKEEFRDSDPDRRTRLSRLSDLAKAGGVRAGELMTAPALTVAPGATLAEAARVMARSGVRRLPVVDGRGVLVGVVGRGDLLTVFLRDDEEIAEQVRREIVAYLFPLPDSAVRVEVREGAVTLGGRVRDTSLIPVAARLIRAVEGVVDVDFTP